MGVASRYRAEIKTEIFSAAARCTEEMYLRPLAVAGCTPSTVA
jgi:hypothetical protein